jgi:ubiquinone/menaquinone biosynthesis C-methylase UbiE
MRVIDQASGRTVRVTGIGSGPADEIFKVYEQLDDPSRLFVTLVDIDLNALASVSEKIDAKGLKDQVKLVQESLIYLASGRHSIDVENQALVYSIGLIENFNDKSVVSFLDYVYKLLASGGGVIIGNFHKQNQNKVLMDHILGWHLFHRNEDAMHRLFEASSFKKRCTGADFEGEGIYFFASCVK